MEVAAVSYNDWKLEKHLYCLEFLVAVPTKIDLEDVLSDRDSFLYQSVDSQLQGVSQQKKAFVEKARPVLFFEMALSI